MASNEDGKFDHILLALAQKHTGGIAEVSNSYYNYIDYYNRIDYEFIPSSSSLFIIVLYCIALNCIALNISIKSSIYCINNT